MKEQFSNEPDDLAWLLTTHARGLDLPEFHSFVIVGNEDWPEEIRLYRAKHPTHTADTLGRIVLRDDGSPMFVKNLGRVR